MKRLSTALLFFLFITQGTLAADVRQMMEELRNAPVDYTVIGTICEQVARVTLEKTTFPDSQYEIINGIEYGNNNRTIGELDVVVFDRHTKNAELVGEVKCWNDLGRALVKAHDQRQRFMGTIQSQVPIHLHSKELAFQQSQFSSLKKFITISQKGGEASGFEMGLDYSLDELMSLRKMMMECQSRGQCARPSKN